MILPGRGASGLDRLAGLAWLGLEPERDVSGYPERDDVGEGRLLTGFLDAWCWEREGMGSIVNLVTWGPRISSTSTSMLSVAWMIGLSTFFLGTLTGTT
jgi:hypothetical protein